MKDQILNPVTLEQSSTLYVCKDCANGTFDGAPLLKEIIDNKPDEMAKSLNEAHNLLCEFMIINADYNGIHFANLLYDIRKMRDAILKGGGWFEFEK